MRADPSVSRGVSSSGVPHPPSSTGAAKTSGGGAAGTDVPPPTTSDDLDIQRMLDHVLTVQAAQGQILVDILDEIRGLRADLARSRSSSLPPPFDDGFDCLLAFRHKKGEYTYEMFLAYLYLFLFFRGRVYF